ncbi:MAG: LysM peptidoglycan-binding domain-containing protein [Chthoniobacterales bacterium]
MIWFRTIAAILSASSLLALGAQAQNSSPGTGNADASGLLNLTRKIDQQNIKIDLLSQQILRLQQEIEHPKLGTTGETSPRASEAAPVSAAGKETHVVAKGETLTSIARLHKVSVEELQKLNHIENDRKLQIGQTLVLPTPAGATASPSPSVAPNE